MALSIDGLEPVSIGGKNCVPKIDFYFLKVV